MPTFLVEVPQVRDLEHLRPAPLLRGEPVRAEMAVARRERVAADAIVVEIGDASEVELAACGLIRRQRAVERANGIRR
jgi:hypothetical protein